MGFKTYRYTGQPNASWTLTDPEPLRFSGPQGLIAQWFRLKRLELPDGPWLVGSMEWLSLAYGPEEAARRWILFEQAEAGVRRLARLERINGQVGAPTRIVMQFAPLQCLSGGIPLVVTEPECVCGWAEELAIDGGGSGASCSWRWMTPQLGFASVVAG